LVAALLATRTVQDRTATPRAHPENLIALMRRVVILKLLWTGARETRDRSTAYDLRFRESWVRNICRLNQGFELQVIGTCTTDVQGLTGPFVVGDESRLFRILGCY
jgi:hypothetical protein